MEQEPTREASYTKQHLLQGIIISIVLTLVVCGLIYFFVFSDKSFTSSATYQRESSNEPSNRAELEERAIIYNDSGFSPKTLTIKKGTTVSFKNTGSQPAHIASNPHPAHNGYPTKGGCVGSMFDVCNSIWPSQSWSFTFDIVGKWGYHNHLNPKESGIIVVQ